MKRGFGTIMAAQFFSSLADNALLIAAIALLLQLKGPAWMVPLLKFFFTISYVLLAAFVGAFADSMPKGRVMFITNTIKVVGCAMMFFWEQLTASGIPPYVMVLVAYSVVGLGAAAYSPAKYGILTELLPARQLVAANGWIEGLTVGSIVLGTVLGGVLISSDISASLLKLDFPFFDTTVDTAPEAAIIFIGATYVIAAIFNLYITTSSSATRSICCTTSTIASACCGATGSGRYPWRRLRCSGAPAPRCSSSCSNGPRLHWACHSRRRAFFRGSSRSASRRERSSPRAGSP